MPGRDTVGSFDKKAKPHVWFLGPKGENSPLLLSLIRKTIENYHDFRKALFQDDKEQITVGIRQCDEFKAESATIQDELEELCQWLAKSGPFFSPRYQSHMLWEVTIPAMSGYFAGMLHNQNNLIHEVSSATAAVEAAVGDDLCRMLGLNPNRESNGGSSEPAAWGHITSGGTVANVEAIWAARNAKFYPIAIRSALSDLKIRGDFPVTLANGTTLSFSDLNSWQLLNLTLDEIVKLPKKLLDAQGEVNTKRKEEILLAIRQHSLHDAGLIELSQQINMAEGSAIKLPPIVAVPGTAHYSLKKAATVLGLGVQNVRTILVTPDGRMDMKKLDELVYNSRQERRPIIAVVGVVGTTEESAVDPIKKILELREELRRDKDPFEFFVHADAAWGGYHASLIREHYDITKPWDLQRQLSERSEPEAKAIKKSFGTETVEVPAHLPFGIAVNASDWSKAQYESLSKCETVTVDPHKSGLIPYPAGALCYRNSEVRHLLRFTAPYIDHAVKGDPEVGFFGLEGSKPGAAVCSVYLSHKIIRPTKYGYGQLIGQSLFNCKMLYAALLSIADGDAYTCVPLPMFVPFGRCSTEAEFAHEVFPVPMEERNKGKRAQLYSASLDKIQADTELLRGLANVGPDQNILCYAFNFKTDGKINPDIKRLNELNSEIARRTRIDADDNPSNLRIILSTTDFEIGSYGPAFLESFSKRLGINSSDTAAITVLRSVVINPWFAQGPQAFLPEFILRLDETVRAAIKKLEGYI